VLSVYDPLWCFLGAQGGKLVKLSFAQIETILKRPLPQAAYDHDWWWANEDVTTTRHVQCRSWQVAGWQVAAVDRARETVSFTR
jgi:hypothetical protein